MKDRLRFNIEVVDGVKGGKKVKLYYATIFNHRSSELIYGKTFETAEEAVQFLKVKYKQLFNNTTGFYEALDRHYGVDYTTLAMSTIGNAWNYLDNTITLGGFSPKDLYTARAANKKPI
jgi:hypothetical protein